MKVFVDRMVFNSRNFVLTVLRYFWPARSVGGTEPAGEQSSQRLALNLPESRVPRG